MRALLFIFSAFAVMGLGFWAYQENYKTQQSVRTVKSLQRDIADLREELGVLRAEWAYLNRPDRLRELADINFDRLGLFSLDARQFGLISQIGKPALAPAFGAIRNPVDVAGVIGDWP
ncbi:MAG: cell division protein FtsL [Paracoccaceae bacterium]